MQPDETSGTIHLLMPLMNRFIYLNHLRQGVTKYFAALAGGGIVAFSSMKDVPDRSVRCLVYWVLVLIGLLILAFDYRCRARAHAVARSIHQIVGSPRLSSPPKWRQWFGEDFYFSSIHMVVTAVLVVFAVRSVMDEGVELWACLGLGTLVYAVQAGVFVWRWSRLSAMFGPWPDDVPSRNDMGLQRPPEDSA